MVVVLFDVASSSGRVYGECGMLFDIRFVSRQDYQAIPYQLPGGSRLTVGFVLQNINLWEWNALASVVPERCDWRVAGGLEVGSVASCWARSEWGRLGGRWRPILHSRRGHSSGLRHRVANEFEAEDG